MNAGGLSTQISKADAQKDNLNTPEALGLKMTNSDLVDFKPQPPKEDKEGDAGSNLQDAGPSSGRTT